MFVVKECTKCKEYKLLEEFHNNKKARFGKTNNCALCTKNRAIKHYYDNRDNRLAYLKKKRIDDAEKIKETAAKHYKKNKDRILSKQKEYYNNNKKKIKETAAKYRENNKDKIIKQRKEYRKLNKDKIYSRQKEYYSVDENRIKRNIRLREWHKDKYEKDALYSLKTRIRSSIGLAFRNKEFKKGTSAREILGCSYEEFKIYIEAQFESGMSWDNRSKWHLDHIIPVSLAKDEQHLIELNHYTNFQPLWAEDNLRKGNKIVEKQLKLL